MSEETGQQPTGAPPAVEYCYRHPNVQTGVHCTRCNRPICPECMTPAPVGYQCPECVAQARREFRRGPGRRVVTGGITATKVLLAALFAVFALELLVGGANALFLGPPEPKLISLGAMQPFLIADGQYWRLFSAIFFHGGLLHIAFNAYALWIFGTAMEQALGRNRFLLVFFVTGFLASATSYAFGPLGSVGVGASGAIFGVFGAFIAYNYRRRDLAQAAANLRWALMLILLNALLTLGIRLIDWRAHLGGLVAGVLAGYTLEGFGTRSTRRIVAVGGIVALLAVGVAMVVWRTDQIRNLPVFTRIFGA
ncbi:MAG TPA: rhomboid family intramembrane serine protease [Actinomycetota bacterium]|nr:rhomboid family intramembrane serine protease [Actinomycetota bacterium]